MPKYTTEKAVYDKLTAFYTWAGKAKWYFRKAKASRHVQGYLIPRDEVICSLARKLVSTQEAICKLCEVDLCSDALALSRIAFENAITIAWIMNREHREERVDLYVHYLHRLQVAGKTYFDEHDPDSEDAKRVREQVDGSHSQIADRLFRAKHGWARDRDGNKVSFRQMASEVLEAETDPAYYLFYRIPSGAIHSDISNTTPILQDVMDRYHFSFSAWRNDRNAGEALSNGNLAGRIMLRALEYQMPPNIAKRAIELQEEIDRTYAPVRVRSVGALETATDHAVGV